MSSRSQAGRDVFEAETLGTMYQLEGVLRRYPALHVRYSQGPVADARTRSVDAESGLELPGLSAHPLQPEDWWHRPVSDWLARQLRRYRHLERQNTDRFAWVLTGWVAGRGPDREPLLRDVVPVARLADSLLEEAEKHYREHFDADGGPED